MSRIKHITLIALGVAGAVLTFLGTIPRYAGLAAAMLLLVADAKKALSKPAPAVVSNLMGWAFLVLCAVQLAGCATAGAVAKACAPATTDETQAVITLWERPDLTTAETIALLEGGKIALCVVSQIANNVLAQASRIQTQGLLGSESPLVVRAQAWLEVHPK